MASTTSISDRSTHVPGQYYGYSLQTTRFLALLLMCDEGWSVSLEVFEDVGAEHIEGDRVAEQVKSTYDGNPVADRSVELWKTFSNWVTAVENGEIVPNKTQFEIYVSRPKTGEIVQNFAAADSEEHARQALAKAKEKLWGSAPEHELRATLSNELKPYVEKVMNADDRIICAIIQSFRLTSGTGSPQADLRALFSKGFIPAEVLDDALDFSLGWVKEKTDRLIEQRQPAIVAVEEFRTKITAFVRKHDRRTILSSFAKKPNQEDVNADLNLKTYVAQLTLVDCSEAEKEEAVRDYLLASADRTKWSVQGLIESSSLDDFENCLVRAWQNLKTRTDIAQSALEDAKRGRYLYSECCLFKTTLEGLDVPSHFVPGSFHALADELTVGWHPDYIALINQIKKV